jgi:hypothetical protein
MKTASGRMMTWVLLVMVLAVMTGCIHRDDDMALPEDPVEREAILGLYRAYRNIAMYEVRDARVIKVQPMIPTEAFVEEHDPRELYCVCVEYMARYKVPWTTQDSSPWTLTVQNVLVIQTKGGHFLALKKSGICPEHCL